MRQSIIVTFILYSFVSNSQTPESVVKSVYNDIINSIGDSRIQPPKLIMVRSEKFTAAFDKKLNTIEFEMKAYALCREFGKDSLNAIAFILGHELGHAYNDHGWLSQAKSAYASTDFGKELRKAKMIVDTMTIYESQADEFSCFFTGVAGYNTLTIGGEVLDAIYKAYKLPEKIKKYPSLSDRKFIVQKSAETVVNLLELFDFSNYQFVQGNYRIALLGYEHIINKFPSREIYNNVGVCYANLALKLFPKDSIKVIVPFEIDFQSRLNSNGERGLSTKDKEEINELFNQALFNFKRTIELDEKYRIGFKNMALVSHFVNDEDRDHYLDKVLKLAETDIERAEYYHLKGLFQFLNNDLRPSKKNLKEAAKLGDPLAEINLHIMKEGEFPISNSSNKKIVLRPVDGVRLQSRFKDSKNKIIDFDQAKGDYELYVFNEKSSKVIIGYMDYQQKEYYKLHTMSSDAFEEKDFNEIIEVYGLPSSLLIQGKKQILKYANERVLLEFQDQKLVKVIKYFNIN